MDASPCPTKRILQVVWRFASFAICLLVRGGHSYVRMWTRNLPRIPLNGQRMNVSESGRSMPFSAPLHPSDWYPNTGALCQPDLPQGNCSVLPDQPLWVPTDRRREKHLTCNPHTLILCFLWFLSLVSLGPT